MISTVFKTFLWILGILAIFLSLFFSDEEMVGFSTSREIKSEVSKTTNFTKLTSFIHGIYLIIIALFISLCYLIPPK